MGCFGGVGDRYVQQAESMFEPIIAAKGKQDEVDRLKTILDDIEELCQVTIRYCGQFSPASSMAQEILGMIKGRNIPKLDPNCPSCQCGGQLCTEHGTGKLETH